MKVYVTTDSETGVAVEIHCREVTGEVTRLERYVQNYSEAIRGTADGETQVIALSDVLYVESVDKRTYVYTKNKVFLTEKRLYELEEVLDTRDFFRCSKSMIVNLRKIIKLRPEVTRNIRATLENDEIIVISRRYAPALKKLIGLEE